MSRHWYKILTLGTNGQTWNMAHHAAAEISDLDLLQVMGLLLLLKGHLNFY